VGYVICKCGNHISDVGQPNNHEGRLISTDAEDKHDDPWCYSEAVYECLECGTIIVGIGHGKVRLYEPVDGLGPINLFKMSS
jgi:hypothetical protein